MDHTSGRDCIAKHKFYVCKKDRYDPSTAYYLATLSMAAAVNKGLFNNFGGLTGDGGGARFAIVHTPAFAALGKRRRRRRRD